MNETTNETEKNMNKVYETKTKTGRVVLATNYPAAYAAARRARARIKVLDWNNLEAGPVEVIDPQADAKKLGRKAPVRKAKRDKRRGEVCASCWMEHSVAQDAC